MDINRRSAITPEDFHSIISISIDGFLLVAMDGTILETNDSYCQLVGYSRDELLKLQIPAIDAVDNKDDVARRFELIIQNGSLRFETKHLHKDGTVIDVEVSANYSPAHGGSIFSFVRDISTQKHHREIMAARLRLIEFSLTHSLDELLRQTLDEAEALTGSCIGFYHFKEPDSQILTLHAWSTKTATMFCKAEGTGRHYPVSQAGVWADCIREGRPVIHNDYASLPHKKGLPDGHAPVVRELVAPIFRHDKIVAIMGIGNKVTDYTQQDVEVISTLADLAWDVVERKKVEEELQKSEGRYRNIVENQTEFVDRYLPGGVLTYVNEALVRFAGIPAGELLGQSFYPFIHEADRDEVVRRIESISRGNPVVDTESRIALPDGRIRWNRWTHTGFFDENGAVVEYQSVGRDITERKEVEEKFRTLTENAPVGIYMTDPSGNCTYANRFWCEIAGMIAQEALGHGWEKGLYEEDRNFIKDNWYRSVQSGGRWAYEYRFLTPQGKITWVHGTAFPLLDSNNEITGYIGTNADITERKLAEKALIESEKRFRSYFELSLIGIAITSPEKGWLHVNDRLCEDLGYTREELQVLTWPEVTHPDDLRADLELFNQVVSGQSDGYSMEKRFIRKDGQTMHAEISARCIRKATGDIDYFVALVQNITDRKKAEERLQRQQNMLARTESIAHVGSWEWEIATDTVTWSDEMFRIFKRNPAEGAPSYEEHPRIYHPDDMKELSRVAEIAQRDGTPYELELRAIRSNGDIRICLARGFAERGSDGKVTHLFGSLQDITERKQIEVALVNSERFLQAIIDTEPECIKLLDVDGNLLMMNRAGLAMIEADSFEQVQGQCVCPLITEPYRDAFTALTRQVFQGIPGSLEFETIGLKGRHVWLETHAVPFCDEHGEITALLGITRDITERRQLEEVQAYLLRAGSRSSGEDFFELLASYLAKLLGMDYVCIDRLQGDCLSAKTLAVYHDGRFKDNVEYTLKDTPCGDVVGKEVCVFPKEVRNLFPQDAALQDLQAESYVGTTIWSFNMKPIGLIAVIGRKELLNSHFAESVLKLVSIRVAGELERRQAEEEKLLVQQQFQQAQKMESLGVLAGGIAHDFNNILAIIIGNCSLAEMNPDRASERIPIIEKAADRAAGLCRQMLAYAGKGIFTMTQFNLAVLVDEMVQMLKATTNQNVVIRSDLSPDIPAINGDASQLRQIIMNLIINASEAIGDAQGVVQVSLAKAVIQAGQSFVDHLGNAIPPGCYARLEVSDSGCGMDEETRRRIFEPFYTTKFTGRGLGMSAVLGIITGHKGALQLTSNPGQGTTFTIYLPIEGGETFGDESSEKMASTLWQGSGTVLLVEDEVQVRFVATTMLENMGFSVMEASNGQEALELYRKNSASISLVITDIGMPIMDGYALFRELKLLKRDLPIIISSGFGDTVVTTRIPNDEIAGLVSKPYRFDKLQDVVKSVVGGAK